MNKFKVGDKVIYYKRPWFLNVGDFDNLKVGTTYTIKEVRTFNDKIPIEYEYYLLEVPTYKGSYCESRFKLVTKIVKNLPGEKT